MKCIRFWSKPHESHFIYGWCCCVKKREMQQGESSRGGRLEKLWSERWEQSADFALWIMLCDYDPQHKQVASLMLMVTETSERHGCAIICTYDISLPLIITNTNFSHVFYLREKPRRSLVLKLLNVIVRRIKVKPNREFILEHFFFFFSLNTTRIIIF